MEGGYEFSQADEPNQLVTVDFFGPLPISKGGVNTCLCCRMFSQNMLLLRWFYGLYST